MTLDADFRAGFKGGKTRAVFHSVTGMDLFPGEESDMTDLKYTPGPWTVRPSNYGSRSGFEIDAPECKPDDGNYTPTICTMSLWTTEHVKELEANARLIAAAPDLLAACKFYLHQYDSSHHGVDKGETPRRIRAAIAKAEGRDA